MSILHLSPRKRVILEDALLLAQDKLEELSKDLRFSKDSRNGNLTKRAQVEALYDKVASLDPAKVSAFDVVGNDDHHDYVGIACRSCN